MLQPLNKRILVEPVLPEKKLILTTKVQSPSKYIVIAIGDEVTKVSVNDIIMLEYAKTVFDDETAYTFVQEENVIAKFKV